jgi:hypothetical protein
LETASPPIEVKTSPAIRLPVPRVQEGDVARGVTGAGHDLETADPLAREKAPGPAAQLRPVALQLPLHNLLAGVDAGVDVAQRDVHALAEPGSQLVDGPDVITVTVGEGDAGDGCAGPRGGADQPVRAARQCRVHEREAISLADKVGVDEAHPRELNEIVRDGGGFHRAIEAHTSLIRRSQTCETRARCSPSCAYTTPEPRNPLVASAGE